MVSHKKSLMPVEEDLFQGIPPGSWVASSSDEDRPIGFWPQFQNEYPCSP